MSVTTNLLSALRHLRYTDRPRMLWVDALCINHNDVEEKNAQIQLMGQIYCRARRSVVSVAKHLMMSRERFPV
ncbi:heterokaryon incompatibility [Xylariaceae sp. AK1471]|nr:heterokaryon incompatibility [Xylariaceae sp. AK1471]